MAYQKLLTKAIQKALPKLYSTEHTPASQKKCVVKFFTPWGANTWYVVEGEERDGDWLFFNLFTSNGSDGEWGYVTLSQLKEISGPFGLKVERDMYYTDGEFEKDKRRLGF